MQPESKLWRMVQKKLPGRSWRLEVATAVGIPDVINVTRGTTSLIELKIAKGNLIYLRKSQWVWLCQYISQSGKNAWLLTSDQGRLSICNYTELRGLDADEDRRYHRFNKDEVFKVSQFSGDSFTDIMSQFRVYLEK